MAALTCLPSVEINLTLTCPFPKSFACNLPDSGHVTNVFQGLSLSCSIGRAGENLGNEVATTLGAFHGSRSRLGLAFLGIHNCFLIFLVIKINYIFILFL